jgi:carboxymethylenebutenolidase
MSLSGGFMKLRLVLFSGAVVLGLFAALRTRPALETAPAQTSVHSAEVSASRPASVASVEITGGTYTLKGTLVRPAGTGPFRAIVYNHGSEDDPSYRFEREIGEFFQQHGYVVLFPYRRGAAGSAGVHWKHAVDAVPVDEQKQATVRLIEEENDDVIAAIDWVANLPEVNRHRIAVAGCSFGGIQTILTAERSDKVFAALSFAGAGMSWRRSPPLQQRLRRAARGARVPLSLMQAENDFDTTPSTELSKILEREHKPYAMKIYPPHGATHMDGHAHFCNHGTAEWGADALAFLDAHVK